MGDVADGAGVGGGDPTDGDGLGVGDVVGAGEWLRRGVRDGLGDRVGLGLADRVGLGLADRVGLGVEVGLAGGEAAAAGVDTGRTRM